MRTEIYKGTYVCERARFVWFANFAENMTGRMDSLFLFPGESQPASQALALALYLVQAAWGPGEGRENVDRSASSRSGPTNGNEVGAACAHGTKFGSTQHVSRDYWAYRQASLPRSSCKIKQRTLRRMSAPGGRATQGPLSGRVTGPNGGTDVRSTSATSSPNGVVAS